MKYLTIILVSIGLSSSAFAGSLFDQRDRVHESIVRAIPAPPVHKTHDQDVSVFTADNSIHVDSANKAEVKSNGTIILTRV